jgi:hypothetical protein
MTAKSLFGPVLAFGLLFSGTAFAQAEPAASAPAALPGGGMHAMGKSAADMAEMHKTMCADHFAKGAARRAYLETRLELTPAQKPLFDKWAQALAANAQTRRANCLAMMSKDQTPPTILERQARMEKRLAEREKALKAAMPSLEALYQALTPDQRKVLDHMHGRMGHRPMAGMHHGMGPGMGMHMGLPNIQPGGPMEHGPQ